MINRIAMRRWSGPFYGRWSHRSQAVKRPRVTPPSLDRSMASRADRRPDPAPIYRRRAARWRAALRYLESAIGHARSCGVSCEMVGVSVARSKANAAFPFAAQSARACSP